VLSIRRLAVFLIAALFVGMGAATITPVAPSAHADTLRSAIVSTAQGQIGVQGDSRQCQPYGPCDDWCAFFANWVWSHAGVNPVPTTGFGRGEGQWGIEHGLFKARPGNGRGDPLPGDMVVYGTPAYAGGGHVAIVESVNGDGTITTINGNWNNMVKRTTINPVTAVAGSGNYHISGYVSPPGAGNGAISITEVTSGIPTLSLFQCPDKQCNQGVANQNFPAQDVMGDFCHLPNTAANGEQDWNLVLDYANLHIGFVRGQHLSGGNAQDCWSVGTATSSGVPTLSMFQCPNTGCNQGVANQNGRDELADICYLPYSGSPTDQDWHFVLDKTNLTIGYVRGQYLDTHTDQTCGAPARTVIPGVGVATGSGVPTLSLFQCPNTGCNQGVANQNGRDLLTDVCQLTGTGAGGDQDWNLVLDYANREVGFVRGQHVDGHAGTDCGSVGTRTSSGVPTLSLFQCPDTGCNQGVANQSGQDTLTDICFLPNTKTDTDLEWHWVYDYGNGHTGWVRGQHLNARSGQHC
jgi:hypothetical protein